mgnify:CR=1 FL=1|jgi:hypothetical protein
MNIFSIATGLTLFLILHALNATYIYFKRKKYNEYKKYRL